MCVDLYPDGKFYTASEYLTAPSTVIGTPGRDVLVGSSGNIVIRRLGGHDLIRGNDTDDAGTVNYWIIIQGNGKDDVGNVYLRENSGYGV